MQLRTIAILGGTGFVGHHLCARLTQMGHTIKVLSRHPERHSDLAVLPSVSLIGVDPYDSASLTAAFNGCDTVINLIGILNEKEHNGRGFYQAHVTTTQAVCEAVRSHHITRLLHMSALGANEQSPSFYQKTKAIAENCAHTAANDTLQVTSFEPSVLFGEGDTFLNRFASLLRLSPGIMLLPCAQALYTPLYVGDLVDIMTQSLNARFTFGQRYALGGPKVYSLKAIVEYIATLIKVKRLIISMPDVSARLLANIMEYLPGKPFSTDNYLCAKAGAVCQQPLSPLFKLQLHSMENIAPSYLGAEALENNAAKLRRNARAY